MKSNSLFEYTLAAIGLKPRDVRQYRNWMLLVAFTLCISFYISIEYNDIIARINQNGHKKSEDNILNGCYHIYLDVGSNIGNQIRKLFEPEKYPNAPLLAKFDQYFGPIENRRISSPEGGSMVCAVGFEPNPVHALHLKELEKVYKTCGWNVKMMTSTGISNRNGITKFYHIGIGGGLNLGGGILPPNLSSVKNKSQSNEITSENRVTLLRLSEFLTNIVSKRQIPMYDTKDPPKVVVKMDIEGSEIDVIPDVVLNGGLSLIDLLMVEWHARYERLNSRREAHDQIRQVLKSLSTYGEGLNHDDTKSNFRYLDLDDETYQTDKLDFPNC